MLFNNDTRNTIKELKSKIKDLEVDLKWAIKNQQITEKDYEKLAEAHVKATVQSENLVITTRIKEAAQNRAAIAEDEVYELQKEIKDLKSIILELKKTTEKALTESAILKVANKSLSEVNTKVQPILDENIRLKSQLETQDELIKEYKVQINSLDTERNSLLNTVTSFQTREVQVVKTDVVSPQVIQPTILSSNTK